MMEELQHCVASGRIFSNHVDMEKEQQRRAKESKENVKQGLMRDIVQHPLSHTPTR